MVRSAAILGLVLAALAMPMNAQAQQALVARSEAPPAQPASSEDAFVAQPLEETALGSITGRENTVALQVASSNQRNTVSGNSVVGNSMTGTVAIDGNAFQNIQGLAVINANSGNNVAINSAMNVTINLAPQ